jgi:hypothetical protein
VALLRAQQDSLDRYLRDHPDDVSGLILSVRVALFFITTEAHPTRDSATAPPRDTPNYVAQLGEVLDHAISLQPDNAAAYYWKSVLYGSDAVMMRNGQPVSLGDSAVAIVAAQRAVALDPRSVEYRTALFIILLDIRGLAAATAVLEDSAGRLHPAGRLWQQIKQVPVPDSAAYSTNDSQWNAYSIGLFGQPYFWIRLIAYRVPRSADSYLAFYRARWPTFTWHETGESGGSLFARFHFHVTRLEPDRNPKGFSAAVQDGLALLVGCDTTAHPERCYLVVIDAEPLSE